MSTTPQLPLAELTTLAMRVLMHEVGTVNTVRFLNQFTNGLGDYTRERDQLFADVSLDAIVAAMQPPPHEAPAANETTDE